MAPDQASRVQRSRLKLCVKMRLNLMASYPNYPRPNQKRKKRNWVVQINANFSIKSDENLRKLQGYLNYPIHGQVLQRLWQPLTRIVTPPEYRQGCFRKLVC
jgi:hypothetical protein